MTENTLKNLELVSDEELNVLVNFYKFGYRQAKKQGEVEIFSTFFRNAYHQIDDEINRRPTLDIADWFEELAGFNDYTLKNLELMTDKELEVWLNCYNFADRQVKETGEAEIFSDFFYNAYNEIDHEISRRQELEAADEFEELEDDTLKNLELMTDKELELWLNCYSFAYGQVKEIGEAEIFSDFFYNAYHEIIDEINRRQELEATDEFENIEELEKRTGYTSGELL